MQNENATLAYIRGNALLSEEALQDVLDEQRSSGRSLLSILRDGGKIGEDELTRMVALSNDIEFVSLSVDMVEPMAVHAVPYEMAARDNLIPVRKEGERLFVAMSEPMNLG